MNEEQGSEAKLGDTLSIEELVALLRHNLTRAEHALKFGHVPDAKERFVEVRHISDKLVERLVKAEAGATP